jgi:hypothetical protein
MLRTRRPGQDAEKPLKIKAKFASDCTCGRRISIGDAMYWNRPKRESLCLECGKKLFKGQPLTFEPSMPAEVQNLLERIAQLKAGSNHENELVVEELRDLHASIDIYARQQVEVRRLLIKKRVRSGLLPITAQFRGACAGCKIEQSVGEPVAFDPEKRSIYCYACLPA